MKTLVLYDSDGQIVFTQTNVTNNYDCLVEDISEDKSPVSVDISTGKCILGDSFEIAEKKRKEKEELERKKAEELEKLQSIEEELSNTQKEILDIKANLVDIEYKNLLV
ncbi:MAG: hypothetical protein E7208_01825 [Clostridium butyricum]|nr:hypothetical protein [Clostridium butyricum]